MSDRQIFYWIFMSRCSPGIIVNQSVILKLNIISFFLGSCLLFWIMRI